MGVATRPLLAILFAELCCLQDHDQPQIPSKQLSRINKGGQRSSDSLAQM
jgi:hypothetical protein